MTLQDALRECQARGTWFRPVSWRKTGKAMALWSEGAGTPGLVEMMWPNGDIDHTFLLTAAGILGEWEAVVPAAVLKERK